MELCPAGQTEDCVMHIHDWWDEGSGEMIFVRYDWCMAFHDWARDL